MRKLIIKIFVGDPIKTARIILPLGVLLAIGIALSEPIWNVLTITLVSAIILTMVSSLYVSFFPPTREGLDDKGKELYDYFNKK